MAEITGKNYSKLFSVKANDTSNVHPEKLCTGCNAKLYRLSSLNEKGEAVVHM